MSKQDKYIVTGALPYANGPLHIGHIAGAYLPADIFVRYSRMRGDDVIFICGTDEHGVPINIKADKEAKSPQALVDHYHRVIKNSFDNLNIIFDNFSGTSRKVHHSLSKEFFLNLHKNGYIERMDDEQYYCSHDKMFLPDRLLEGVCPYCSFDYARGDECPSCGKWLESEKLLSPRCKLCGNSPSKERTEHWYLSLDKFSPSLKSWIEGKDDLKSNVRQFALSWIKEGLNKRAITRDLDWGVKVPLEGVDNKVLYVWFDAPIGYISSTIEWSEGIGVPDRWKDYWFDKDCKLVHFIGKDNIPFHIVVWPSLLMGQDADYILPYAVPANEHLTIEGKKLSTSDGNVVWVDDFLKYFPADALRYYLASMAPQSKDSDFSWFSFQTKNNKELNNVLGNFVNRTLSFIVKNFAGRIPLLREDLLNTDDNELVLRLRESPSRLSTLLSSFNVRDGIFAVMELAHQGNRYFDSKEPWKLVKSDKDYCGVVLHISALIIKFISALLYPFLPETALKLWHLLGESTELSDVDWEEISSFELKEGSLLSSLSLLFKKIEDKELNAIIEELKAASLTDNDNLQGKGEEEDKKEDKGKEKKRDIKLDAVIDEVSVEDFNKLNILVGTVLSCEKVRKSNKLIKLSVDFGDFKRQIISGVALDYAPEDLIGKQVLAIVNLKKVKLMGEFSEGMILFAKGREGLVLISPVEEVPEGSKVS